MNYTQTFIVQFHMSSVDVKSEASDILIEKCAHFSTFQSNVISYKFTDATGKVVGQRVCS